MTLEARKLQMTGGSTYLVTLPKRWVTDTHLKAGDMVFFARTPNGGLCVQAQPSAERGPRRALVVVDKPERREHLLRRLIAAYIAGNEVLEVEFKGHHEPEMRRVVREFTRMVIGPEILEETKDAIVIQDLSDPAQFSQEKCLRRMHLTIRSMHEEAMTALRTLNLSLARDVEARDEDIDRLFWMTAKQFNLMLVDAGLTAKHGIDLGTSSSYRQAAKILERIGDHAERIAASVLSMEKGVDKKLMDSLDAASAQALSMFDRSFTSLLSGSVEDANSAIDDIGEFDKTMNRITEAMRTMKGRDVFALAGVVESIGRTAHYSSDLAEIAINLVASRSSAGSIG
jgi:phosphate uptake regulator